MHLECGVCIVRDWNHNDKTSLVRVANNRNIWRNLTHTFPYPYTDADAVVWFTRLSNMSVPTHWAIEVGRAAVGGIGCDIGIGIHGKTARFGYWLAQPYWGRGIMTAAVRDTTGYIFNHLDVARLEAHVFEWNLASMRVLEKCGFVREGVLRRRVFKDGEIIDSVLYALVQ